MKPTKLDFSLQYDHLDCDSGPYVHRWIAEAPWGSLRLHRWVGDDDPRAMHDHPWNFWTLILKGAYVDEVRRVPTEDDFRRGRAVPGPKGLPVLVGEVMKPGALRYRPAKHEHTVVLLTKECWSLVLTGPKVRAFGFRWQGTWVRASTWFGLMPKFPCS